MPTDCYPIALVSAGLPCVVVGGGRVAERRVRGLLAAGAAVRVVAPQVTDGLQESAREGAIELVEREAVPGDLEGARVVMIAGADRPAAEALALEARRRGLLVNVADVPDLCDFFVPATVARGPIRVSVTTGGASPALARRLRVLIEQVVGEEHGELADLMGELRGEVRERFATQQERAAAWEKLLDSDVLALLRESRDDEARTLATRLLGLHP